MKKFLLAFVMGFALTACTNTADTSCQCEECMCDTCLCGPDNVEITDSLEVVEVADSVVNE